MLSIDKQIDSLKITLSKRKLIEFIQYCWVKKNSPFIVGIPAIKICAVLDNALEKFRDKKSSFFIIQVPPRHGKSEIISRYFPVRFLGEFPEKELILVSHTATKAYEFSRFGRKLIRESIEVKKLYPHLKLSKDAQNVQTWELDNGLGKAQYFGIKSGIAGSGADCMLLDDYCKNREDADSEKIQNKTWDEFTDGIITRRHEPSIVGILATRWNVDDIIGRCQAEIKINPDFPVFEIIKLPAIDKKYKKGVLFPERFSEEYYRTQKGILSEHAFSALYQQEPTVKGGNSFQYENIRFIDAKDVPRHKQTTVIDLASSKVTRESRDPDYTVCMNGFMVYDGPFPKLYITDLIRFRETATKRNIRIKQFILRDNNAVYMESFGGYKDSYEIMHDELQGIKVVHSLTLSGDKEVKAEPLEAIFEACNVYIVKAPWNEDLKNEIKLFPGAPHDDQADCAAMIYHIYKRKPRMRGGRVII